MCRTAPENTGKTGTCSSHALCICVPSSLQTRCMLSVRASQAASKC